MGLLESLNTDEARMGLGLLAAGGYQATPMNFGQRVQMAFQGEDARKQSGQKSKLLDMQMANYESEIEARKLAGVKDARKQSFIESIFGGGQPATSPGAFVPSADGMGPTMPPTMQQSPGILANMTPDKIAMLKMQGIDIADIYKFTQEPQKFEAGSTYRDRNTGQERFIPKVPDGMAPDKAGFYNPLPGYVDSVAKIEGAKTASVEGAKAGFDLVQVAGPDGAMRFVPRSTVLGNQPTAPSAPAPQSRPMASRPGESDRFAILSQELERAKTSGNTSDVQTIEREISRLPASEKTGASTSGLSVPGFQATPTNAQKLAVGASEKLNESWIKNTYEPLTAGRGAINDTLDSVRIARGSIEKMGGTGWATETKAQAANILTGLGVSAGNAKMFATNAQTFQSAAMERVQAALTLQKGPQTDQDATRQAKTFAQLSNTTDANNFILDTIEAKSMRDKMKADFYQKALPIAQQKGDLNEIDREWSKRAPSIFDMPTMKKWGDK